MQESSVVHRRPLILVGSEIAGASTHPVPAAVRQDCRKYDGAHTFYMRLAEQESSAPAPARQDNDDSCPISTPRLKASSEVSTWGTGKLQSFGQRKRKAEAMHQAKPKAISQRLCHFEPTIFSNGHVDNGRRRSAISINDGNHSTFGTSPNVDAISVIEWATVKEVMMATSGRSAAKRDQQTDDEQQMIGTIENMRDAAF